MKTTAVKYLNKRQAILDNTFVQLAKVTNSLLFGAYDTDVDQEVTNLIDAEMVLRTAMTQDGDEVILTVGQLKDKWQALYNTSLSNIYLEGLEYLKDCLEELTEAI
jgi:hypothetical protein